LFIIDLLILSPPLPYTCIRNLQISIDKIVVKHEKFQDMVFNVNTATNVDFKELRKGLVKDVRASDRQVKELKTRAVDMTERNRDKFQHISDHELGQRKKFVDELQRSINGEWRGMFFFVAAMADSFFCTICILISTYL
jgi:hypothetical protein